MTKRVGLRSLSHAMTSDDVTDLLPFQGLTAELFWRYNEEILNATEETTESVVAAIVTVRERVRESAG